MNIFNDFLKRFHSISDPIEIMEQFFMDREVLDTFIGNLLYAKSDSKRLATLRFLKAMFELLANGDERNPCTETSREWFSVMRANEENQVFCTVTGNINGIKSIFEKEYENNFFINTYSKQQKKLGAEKIAILEFVEVMLSVKNMGLTTCLANSGLFTTATKYFKEYPDNNIYGNLYTKICKGIVNSTNEPLVTAFLEKTQFLETFEQMISEREYVGVRGKKYRQLNMGHVISILRAFKESSKEWIVKIREESETWQAMEKDFLLDEIERQDKQIAPRQDDPLLLDDSPGLDPIHIGPVPVKNVDSNKGETREELFEKLFGSDQQETVPENDDILNQGAPNPSA